MLIDMLIDYRPPARRVNHRGSRTPIPRGDELLPTRHHREAKPEWGIWVCWTRAGRPRAFCSYGRDGLCIHCGCYDAAADRPLGEK
jgi:hypothetical protein